MYDVNYFIKKFEAIPEDKWCTTAFNIRGSSCALGHLGCYWTDTIKCNAFVSEEAKVLNVLVNNFLNYQSCVWMINDGYCAEYNQPTPKQRILAALYDIRDKELSEANVREASKIVNEVAVFKIENDEKNLMLVACDVV